MFAFSVLVPRTISVAKGYGDQVSTIKTWQLRQHARGYIAMLLAQDWMLLIGIMQVLGHQFPRQ